MNVVILYNIIRVFIVLVREESQEQCCTWFWIMEGGTETSRAGELFGKQIFHFLVTRLK